MQTLSHSNHMQQVLTFFIAGTMQGTRPGLSRIDQSYRPALQQAILSHYPGATIYCPLEVLRKRFEATQDEALTAYAQETAATILESNSYGPLVREIRGAFVDLVNLASTADVLVAYLPDHEASMGTAMEMWSAFSCDKVVITISTMTQNLAIVSTSTVILPSLEHFETFLASGRLVDLLGKRQRDL